MNKLWGVNLIGGEFGDQKPMPGALGQEYMYRTDADGYLYYARNQLNLLRIPFRWERVQRQFFWDMSEPDMNGLRQCLDLAQGNNELVILDMHNFGRYYGEPLTRADDDHFADAWLKIARAFGSHPALWGYELMNEPHDLPNNGADWPYLCQHATDVIRSVDKNAYILIPGYSWQSAPFWRDNNETLDIHDAAGRLLYAAHCYFDADSTGSYAHGYDGYASIGAERVEPFLSWLAEHNAQGILTEYGVPPDAEWLEVLDRFLNRLDQTPEIVGGTYWASSGPWWTDYKLSVDPSGFGSDKPQMALLRVYAGADDDWQEVTGTLPDGRPYVLRVGAR